MVAIDKRGKTNGYRRPEVWEAEMKALRIWAFPLVAFLLAISLFSLGCARESDAETNGPATTDGNEKVDEGKAEEEGPAEEAASGEPFVKEEFQNIKSAHYVASDPPNNALLSTAPLQVAIDFNFTLAPPSAIHVTRDGLDVTTGPTTISADKLVLVVPIDASVTGNYGVDYTACWPDGSCHTGSFGFSVQLP